MPISEPEHSFIPISQLVFDPENPRLPSTITTDDTAPVIEWMLQNANIIELMGSIGAKGFYPAEPLLVVVSPSHPDKYEVVEGNRRLTAAMLLLNPQLAKTRRAAVNEAVSLAEFKPDVLPVLIYEDRKDILDYLGYRHITGVKAWSALAKARYLRELRENLPASTPQQQYRLLARQIGSRTDYVELLLVGVAVMDLIEEHAYFKIKGLNEEAIDFGVLYTALRKPNISDFLGLDWEDPISPARFIIVPRLEELIRWMSEKSPQGFTRLGESRNLGKLDKVVGHAKALQAFRDGRSLSEAALQTDEPLAVFQQSYREALYKLRDAQANIHLIEKFDSSDYETTREVAKLSRTIHNTVRDKVDGLEELD